MPAPPRNPRFAASLGMEDSNPGHSGERPTPPGLMDVRVIRSLGDLVVDLQVDFAGMAILVRAGTFVVDGQPGQLLQDERYTVPTRGVAADLQLYLVKSRDTGEYRILVDDVKVDNDDVAFNFPPDCPYLLILSLVLVSVPANCSDLQQARKTIYKVKV